MMPPRQYGRKKPKPGRGATAIFGAPAHSSPRDPLADITAGVENLALSPSPTSVPSSPTASPYVPSSPPPSTIPSSPTPSSPCTLTDSRHPELAPLLTTFKLGISGWDELLQVTTSVVKIAEASYAQVYRITASTGYSIIKIVQLKVADDPESIDCDTASPVELVISEMKIMNEMTEVPGFVAFKGAHLIQGIPSKRIERARNNFSAQRAKDGEEPSLFPDSSNYTENSIFLAIELGDAGDVLETFPITDRHQFWSILLGVIMALSRAETVAEFEHRDLHENNICVSVRKHGMPDRDMLPQSVKFGRSYIEVTLIDYGLSRAKLLSGEVVFNDLETDLVIFQQKDGQRQFDTYRRMRNHLFTGEHKLEKKKWHTEASRHKNNGHTWQEFTPYTNVLWIWYLLNWLEDGAIYKYDREKDDVEKQETKSADFIEFRRRLNTRTKKEPFESATEVLNFALQSGWVTEEQCQSYGVDCSILSQ